MNAARLESLTRGLNGMAKKVLEACPIAEPWTLTQITGELFWQGLNINRAVVEGCVCHLREVGLLKEPRPGSFQRVAAKTPRVALVPAAHPGPQPEQTMKATKKSEPLDQLGDLAVTARSLANQLNELAADIEAAALEAEERLQSINADAGKLSQLRELLKGLA